MNEKSQLMGTRGEIFSLWAEENRVKYLTVPPGALKPAQMWSLFVPFDWK